MKKWKRFVIKQEFYFTNSVTHWTSLQSTLPLLSKHPWKQNTPTTPCYELLKDGSCGREWGRGSGVRRRPPLRSVRGMCREFALRQGTLGSWGFKTGHGGRGVIIRRSLPGCRCSRARVLRGCQRPGLLVSSRDGDGWFRVRSIA